MKFYVCEHCGNMIQFIKDKGVPVVCCGEKMKELIPGVSDGAAEKHVPAVKVEASIVPEILVPFAPEASFISTSVSSKAAPYPLVLN